jgi:hypothetical protein
MSSARRRTMFGGLDAAAAAVARKLRRVMLNFMPQSGYRGKMLIANPRGGYSFIKGIAPYSGGVVAADGFEIVHACFRQPVPLKQGFDRVTAHLGEIKRPMQALCGMELRSPRPFSFQGFNDFNAGYVGVLKSWEVFLDGVNPIARTNVAPEIGAPAEPSLFQSCSSRPGRARNGSSWMSSPPPGPACCRR